MTDSADLEALFVRLYFDRHIMARLAVDLRGRGFDVLRTEEAGKDTASDGGSKDMQRRGADRYAKQRSRRTCNEVLPGSDTASSIAPVRDQQDDFY